MLDTRTTTFPVVAPLGTVAVTLVADQAVVEAVVPLNVTVLVPLMDPKPLPVMMIDAPTAPELGERPVMAGAVTTVKARLLLFTPAARTTTLPVDAPAGTVVTIDVADQLVGVAVVPLNVTVLAPWLAPKLVPAMVIVAPTPPLVGERFEILGGCTTLKLTPLLLTPCTRTTTLPVVAPVGTAATMLVADQVVVDAVVPLNVTVLLPFVAPNPLPAIVTDAPTAPVVGERLVIAAAGTTVNATPLLLTLDTRTTTLPVVAPPGTVATMLVVDQLVVEAVTPLNVTVLVPFVEPNAVPVIVTAAPTGALVGERDEITGAASAAVTAPSRSTAPPSAERSDFMSPTAPRASTQTSRKYIELRWNPSAAPRS
jgi:hypothetical protein